jgi:hypothetical protein
VKQIAGDPAPEAPTRPAIDLGPSAYAFEQLPRKNAVGTIYAILTGIVPLVRLIQSTVGMFRNKTSGGLKQ